MNNLPLKPVGGVCGEAGGVCVGAQGAPSANFLSFPQSMADTGLVGSEDAMASSIVRLESEKDELNAEVALLREQARILQAECDEARLQYRSTHALAEVLVKSRNEFLQALRDIANMDTSQEASGGQCAAVWRAMEVLK